ncbi:Rpn family recombination-promoting nuclease/putative transposase, partial [Salmonella enterica]|uniref:Rpn family recombination-promoting nuclease/putative transposase n=1 Tax=Salmonella enterica TaxID=28901 RepID=UPI0021B18DE2
FYHGSRSPYPFSTNWLDCFSNPEQARKVYTRGFPLVDVTVIDNDEIMNYRRMAALPLLMKHIRQRDMMELLDRLPRVIVEWISPELMTIAQQLEQIGVEKGIKFGEQRGIEKGEHEAAMKIARILLKIGMSRKSVL